MLAAGVVIAVVRGARDSETARPAPTSPEPAVTMTFTGLPPFESPTPSATDTGVPGPTDAPTDSPAATTPAETVLPRTGARDAADLLALALIVMLIAGFGTGTLLRTR